MKLELLFKIQNQVIKVEILDIRIILEIPDLPNFEFDFIKDLTGLYGFQRCRTACVMHTTSLKFWQ